MSTFEVRTTDSGRFENDDLPRKSKVKYLPRYLPVQRVMLLERERDAFIIVALSSVESRVGEGRCFFVFGLE